MRLLFFLKSHRIFNVAEKGQLAELKLILAKDPKLALIKDNNGYLLIHRAIIGGDIATIFWLIDNFVNQLQPDLIHYAASFDNVLLLEYLVNKKNYSPKQINPENNWTPIITAAACNSLTVIKWLVQIAQVHINQHDNHGNTALITACRYNQYEVVQWLLKQTTIKINKKNIFGDTALIIAAKKGFLNIVSYLIEHGKAKINIINKHGQTALISANNHGQFNIVTWLLDNTDSSKILQRSTNYREHQLTEFKKYCLLQFPKTNGEDYNTIIDQTLLDITLTKHEINQFGPQYKSQIKTAPVLIRCPLSNKTMTIPVTAADGYCYEKVFIEQHINKSMRENDGYWQSPVNNQQYNNPYLIVNTKVSHEIICWHARAMPSQQPQHELLITSTTEQDNSLSLN